MAQESLIQAERDLIYQARDFERFRRENLVSIARDYFDLLQTKSRIANQWRQLKSFEELERSTAGRVDAGRLDSFQKLLAKNQVVNATASLANTREQYILQVERFKIRLGLPVDTPIFIGEDMIELRPGHLDQRGHQRSAGLSAGPAEPARQAG